MALGQFSLHILTANLNGGVNSRIRREYGIWKTLEELQEKFSSSTRLPDLIFLQECWTDLPLQLPKLWTSFSEFNCGFSGIGKGLKVLYSPTISPEPPVVISERILAFKTSHAVFLNCYAPQRNSSSQVKCAFLQDLIG